MDITFNFIGMCAADWQQAYQFFIERLGLQAELNPAYGDWANLGAAWAGYHSETHSLVCELFDQGRQVDQRWWGKNQNVRPAIHVADLDAAVAHFQQRGLHFSEKIEDRAWGRQIEFDTLEGIRWSLAYVPGKPIRMDLSQPQFGHIAIKTADFAAQTRFYSSMGFVLTASSKDYALFEQTKPNHPFIVLLPGGESIAWESYQAPHPERSQPFFLSFMTPDIQAAAQACTDLNLPHLRPLTKHEDWGGTDMVITDADGNAIQIVQYE